MILFQTVSQQSTYTQFKPILIPDKITKNLALFDNKFCKSKIYIYWSMKNVSLVSKNSKITFNKSACSEHVEYIIKYIFLNTPKFSCKWI